MQFYTAFAPPPFAKEELDPVSKVESTGYIPADKLITQLLYAGEHLAQVRGDYDFSETDEVPEDFVDHTRSPGFDVVDAQILAESFDAKVRRSKPGKPMDVPPVVKDTKVEPPVKEE